MSRKHTQMVRQLKGKILASDSDSEFECSDISHGTDDFYDESLPAAVADSDSTPVPPATDETTSKWDIYDNRDDYCPEWLLQYQRRHGVLVETVILLHLITFSCFSQTHCWTQLKVKQTAMPYSS